MCSCVLLDAPPDPFQTVHQVCSVESNNNALKINYKLDSNSHHRFFLQDEERFLDTAVTSRDSRHLQYQRTAEKKPNLTTEITNSLVPLVQHYLTYTYFALPETQPKSLLHKATYALLEWRFTHFDHSKNFEKQIQV